MLTRNINYDRIYENLKGKYDMNDIKRELEKLSDEKYAQFSRKSCPDTDRKILGIRIPMLRKMAKQIVKNDYAQEVLKQLNGDCFEEIILKGLIIGYLKIDIVEKLPYIKEFIPQIDSWAICDTFCPTLKVKENDLNNVWNFILPYLNSEKEFEVRFAVIMMLDYFLIDEYIDEVIVKLDQVCHEGYYAKMAISWCLAEIGIKYNEKLMKYLLEENNLDQFTYNKTLQKMRESFRIDANQKEILKKMKK